MNYFETTTGKKIEQKFANHCLCSECCIERGKINSIMLKDKEEFVYFPEVSICPYGSNFLIRNKEWVDESKKQWEDLMLLADKTILLLKGNPHK